MKIECNIIALRLVMVPTNRRISSILNARRVSSSYNATIMLICAMTSASRRKHLIVRQSVGSPNQFALSRALSPEGHGSCSCAVSFSWRRRICMSMLLYIFPVLTRPSLHQPTIAPFSNSMATTGIGSISLPKTSLVTILVSSCNCNFQRENSVPVFEEEMR